MKISPRFLSRPLTGLLLLLACFWSLCASAQADRDLPGTKLAALTPADAAAICNVSPSGTAFPSLPGGFYRDPQRSHQHWYLHATGTPRFSLTWMTYANGRPVWLAVKLPGKTDVIGPMGFVSGLYRVRRDPQTQGIPVQQLVGEFSAEAVPGHDNKLAIRWQFNSAGADLDDSAITSTCLQREFTSVPTQSNLDGYYEHTIPSQNLRHLDQRLLLQTATPGNGQLRSILAIFDVNNDPVWLRAEGSTSSRDENIVYPSLSLAPNDVCTNCQPTTTPAGLFNSLGNAQFSFPIATSAGTARSFPGGQSIWWQQPTGTQFARVEQPLTLTLSTTECAIPDDGYTCPVTVEWSIPPNVPSTAKLVRRQLYLGKLDVEGASARSGSLTEHLTPQADQPAYDYLIEVPGETAPLMVTPKIRVFQTQSALPVSTWAPHECGVQEPGVQTATPMQHGAWRAWRQQPTVNGIAGQWHLKYPGTWWQVEYRQAAAYSGKIRMTWFTYTSQRRPIWLQTEWVPYFEGGYFVAHLREYRLSPVTKLRTAGRNVGIVEGQRLQNNLLALRRTPTGSANVAEFGPLGWECLYQQEPYNLGRTANGAHVGIYHGAPFDDRAAADAVSVNSVYQTDYTQPYFSGAEDLLTFDASAERRPVWLVGYASQMGSNPATPKPLRYVKSPYLQGYPTFGLQSAGGWPDCYRGGLLDHNCSTDWFIAGHWSTEYQTLDQIPTMQFSGSLSATANRLSETSQGTVPMENAPLAWSRPDALYDAQQLRSEARRLETAESSAARIVLSKLVCKKASQTANCEVGVTWAAPRTLPGQVYKLEMQRPDYNFATTQLIPEPTVNGSTWASASGGLLWRTNQPDRYIFVLRRLGFTGTGQFENKVIATSTVFRVLPALPPPPPPAYVKVAPSTCVSPNDPYFTLKFPYGNPNEYAPQVMFLATVESGTCNGQVSSTFAKNDPPPPPPTTEVPENNAITRVPVCPSGVTPQPGTYRYRIRACNYADCGNPSPLSEPVTVCNGSSTSHLPQIPVSVRANAVNGEPLARIRWKTGPGDGVTNFFQIGRAPSSSAAPSVIYPQRTIRSQQEDHEQNVEITGDPVYFFKVRACVTEVESTCSDWSAAARLIVGELPDDPRGAQYNPTLHDYHSGQTQLAGALTGQPGVVGGSATYSLPIEMPPGRRGMQPAVSIDYSSRAGNGPLGMGFSLSAGGAVSRCPWTRATDGQDRPVQFDQNDKLCLDGQRLLRDPDSPQLYGDAGAIYRTELDSWTRVTQLSGSLGADTGLYFKVELRDGEIRYYGQDFPQAGSGTQMARVRPGELTGAATTMSWLLNTREDRSGNQVHYRYTVAGPGEHLLAEIAYTGQGSSPGDRRVRLVYENRPDLANAYLGGGLTVQTQRLQRIETGLWTGSTLDLLANYKLRYVQSNATGRSLLKGVQRCGDLACSPGVSLPETTFAWADTPTEGVNFHASPIQWPLDMPAPNHFTAGPTPGNPSEYSIPSFTDHVKPVGDVDGDGAVEVIRTVSHVPERLDRFLVSLNPDRTAKGFVPFVGINPERFADFNNDGRVDPAWVDTNGALNVQFWQGQSLQQWNSSAFTTVPPHPLCPLVGQRVESFQLADLNSDGLADVLAECSSTAAHQLVVHINQTAPAVPPTMLLFQQLVPRDILPVNGVLRSINSPRPTFQASFDFDGNGLVDVFAALCARHCEGGNPLAEPEFDNRVYRLIESQSGYALAAGEDFASPQWFPSEAGVSMDDVPGNARRHSFSDINGDGLVDMILVPRSRDHRCRGVWSYRMNKGNGKFGSLLPFEGELNKAAIGEEEDGVSCRSVARDWDSRQAELTTFEDLDGDGRTEILVPRDFALDYCTRVTVMSNGKPLVARACPPDPRHPSSEVGFDEVTHRLNLADVNGFLQANSLFAPYDINYADNNHFPPVGAEALDQATYLMSRLIPVQLDSGGYTLIEESLPETFVRQVNNQGTNREGLDIYGDGLGDAFGLKGCRVRWPSVAENTCPRRDGPDQSPTVAPSASFLVNNGAGYTPGFASKSIEMLESVSDGFSAQAGVQVRWVYDALGSKAGRAGGLPLYRIPSRDAPGEGYVDARHFYFTSSMNVVARMEMRNGVGGFNGVNYGYEEAMYNNTGRGFVGFRKIVTEDEAAGIRSATMFHQKFPLVSQTECQVTQKLSDDLAQLKCDGAPARLLSRSTAGAYLCNLSPCPAAPAPGVIWRVLNNSSTQQRWEATEPTTLFPTLPDLRGRLVADTSTTILTRDAIDNVTLQTVVVTDWAEPLFGQTALRMARQHTTETESQYTNDATVGGSWWLGRLDRQVSTVSQTYGDGHPAGDLGIPLRTTTTLYAYNSQRLPRCEALFSQPPVGAVGAVDAMCDTQPNAERRVIRQFADGYGNVTQETTTARDESEPRSVATAYSAGGYFPQTVTDGFARTVSSVVSPKFGVPISTTDANGLITTVALDALGRPSRTVPPERNGQKMAFPAVSVYERCELGVVCPAHAVMRMVQSQYGAPQSVTYTDVLGRTLRTSTKLLDAAFQSTGLDDLNASVTDTLYDAQGRVARQYEPNRSLSNPLAYTTFVYDEIHRPLSKLQRFNAAHGDSQSNADNFRRTDYVYKGLKTDIAVCQTATTTQRCAQSLGNTDGSFILNMSRQFDSAQRLLSTTDAMGQTTKYWFDGAGNPLRVQDVKGFKINGVYNDFGHRTQVTDPSSGTWFFGYNGYGELKTRTDARGRVSSHSYDKLGRPLTRSWNQPNREGTGTHSFTETTEYDNAGLTSYGTVKWVRRVGASGAEYEFFQRSFTYDALARPIETRTQMQVGTQPVLALTTQTRYDANFGRVKQLNYPDSAIDGGAVSLYQAYNAQGLLVREGFAADYVPDDPETSDAIRSLEKVDGRNLPITERLGARGAQTGGQQDYFSLHYYDSSGWLMAQCVRRAAPTCDANRPNPVQTTTDPLDQRYRFDVYGNLTKQWHLGQWDASSTAEGEMTYQYDQLMRMTRSTRRDALGVLTSVDYAYDEIGGLTKKSDYSANSNGAYVYQPNNHRLNSVALASDSTASFQYDANGNVTQRLEAGIATDLTYDIDNLPIRISRQGLRSDFYEGPGGRWLQRLKSGGTGVRDTWMLEKTYEREVVGATIQVERYYLSGGHLLTIKPGENGRKLNYLHTDRLGSPVSISEKPLPPDGSLGTATATLVEHRGFDAFGKALDGQWTFANLGRLNLPNNAQPNDYNVGKRNQRGFTGHEHLDEFALIHMNGRAYDYNLGRFLGVDPFIEKPSNSQSLNPYAYLMNSPLSGTDPTGYAKCYVSDPATCLEEGKNSVYKDDGTFIGTIERTDTDTTVRFGISLNEHGREFVQQNGAKLSGQTFSWLASDRVSHPGLEQLQTESSRGAVGNAVASATHILGMDQYGENMGANALKGTVTCMVVTPAGCLAYGIYGASGELAAGNPEAATFGFLWSVAGGLGTRSVYNHAAKIPKAEEHIGSGRPGGPLNPKNRGDNCIATTCAALENKMERTSREDSITAEHVEAWGGYTGKVDGVPKGTNWALSYIKRYFNIEGTLRSYSPNTKMPAGHYAVFGEQHVAYGRVVPNGKAYVYDGQSGVRYNSAKDFEADWGLSRWVKVFD